MSQPYDSAALIRPGTALAEVAQGRWISRCGHPHRCSSAADVFPFDDGFICADCGAATGVIWPAVQTVEGVERLLMMRPNPNNRNWTPDETVQELLQENVAHGVLSGLELDTPGKILLVANDTEITTDKLPALQGIRRTELGRGH